MSARCGSGVARLPRANERSSLLRRWPLKILRPKILRQRNKGEQKHRPRARSYVKVRAKAAGSSRTGKSRPEHRD